MVQLHTKSATPMFAAADLLALLLAAGTPGGVETQEGAFQQLLGKHGKTDHAPQPKEEEQKKRELATALVAVEQPLQPSPSVNVANPLGAEQTPDLGSPNGNGIIPIGDEGMLAIPGQNGSVLSDSSQIWSHEQPKDSGLSVTPVNRPEQTENPLQDLAVGLVQTRGKLADDTIGITLPNTSPDISQTAAVAESIVAGLGQPGVADSPASPKVKSVNAEVPGVEKPAGSDRRLISLPDRDVPDRVTTRNLSQQECAAVVASRTKTEDCAREITPGTESRPSLAATQAFSVADPSTSEMRGQATVRPHETQSPDGAHFTRIEVTPQSSPVAFHSMRLAEHLGGPELRFAWRSEDSGAIQLSTTLRQHDIEMTVRTERADTANAFRAELPVLDGRLHERSLRLGEVNIVIQGQSTSGGTGMSGQHQNGRDWKPSPALVSREAADQPVDPMALSVESSWKNGRVSVRV